MAANSDRNLESWRGSAIPLRLRPQDLDLLDIVLCLAPELRIATFIGQWAREHGLVYPVETPTQLAELLGDEQLLLDGHKIDADSVLKSTCYNERFPLQHEGE